MTTSTVSGQFKKRNTAVGEITFSQKFTDPHFAGSSCGLAKLEVPRPCAVGGLRPAFSVPPDSAAWPTRRGG